MGRINQFMLNLTLILLHVSVVCQVSVQRVVSAYVHLFIYSLCTMHNQQQRIHSLVHDIVIVNHTLILLLCQLSVKCQTIGLLVLMSICPSQLMYNHLQRGHQSVIYYLLFLIFFFICQLSVKFVSAYDQSEGTIYRSHVKWHFM